MSYELVNWKNEWEENPTPANAENFRHMDEGIFKIDPHKFYMKITSAISAGTAFTIPCSYKVGAGVLDVYLRGERLNKSSDDAGTDGSYCEVGEEGSISNQIKTTTDWSVPEGRWFEFEVRGTYE